MGETTDNCKDDCPPQPQPKPQLDHSREIMYGQYTQFNQQADYKYVGGAVRDAGYTGFSGHVASNWGALVDEWFCVYDKVVKKFDLAVKNIRYWTRVDEFLEWVGGINDLRIEISLLDGYYTSDWTSNGASKPNPFLNNKQGLNLDDELNIPESKPWFQHVSWKTTGKSFEEKVVSYQINPRYKWLWEGYLIEWGRHIKAFREKYPQSEAVWVRYINENHARYRTEIIDGKPKLVHVGGFGGEDKIFQILRMEWEKLGLKHGKDFVIVNDWMAWEGRDFLVKTWTAAGEFDRHPNHRWMREVHIGCDQKDIDAVVAAGKLKPQYADSKFVVISTDGCRPEAADDPQTPQKDGYIDKMRDVLKMKLPITDIKVPSETAVSGQKIYWDDDFMRSFKAQIEVMRRITQ